MIVPMKKVSLLIRGDKKAQTLKTLRSLGIVHIKIEQGSGEKLAKLNEQIALLEKAIFSIEKAKGIEQSKIDTSKALDIANEISELLEEKRKIQAEKLALVAELNRLKNWGEVDPEQFSQLAQDGVKIQLYEMPKAEYELVSQKINTVRIDKTKTSVKFMVLDANSEQDKELISSINSYRFNLPTTSTQNMRDEIERLNQSDVAVDKKINGYSNCIEGLKNAVKALNKEVEFETYASGMEEQSLSTDSEKMVNVAHFKGYVEQSNLDKLKQTAKDNSWGLFIEDPTEDDDVPTKLKNNKFVSLIYPLTDFLGTVPGYFEYDISGWFLSFILVFFGIIFGDGGYGLFITAICAIPIIKSIIAKKPIQPAFLLIALFGLSTVLWGMLTCTWFGLSVEQLPQWLKSLSIPVISNVYADKIWQLPWTEQGVGLTTAQNLQIFCFSLALIQLTVAHIKGAIRDRKSLKILGDIGSILQLFGIYYIVLSLVVNPVVFSFGLVVSGIPVGTLAIALIGVGFVLSFVFANYEGNIVKSILASLANIVSVLLGVVNVFSDIVSYIRLWAVGLAGAAISATVNELAGPMIGGFAFTIVAIFLLVFGHGLNMILNVLSVIVHGIRLNTLEFSSHLDMSWSGHKFTPFEE